LREKKLQTYEEAIYFTEPVQNYTIQSC